MYKVIKYFTDLKDNNHAYRVGDTFPRAGMTVSDDRLKELAGNRNKQGAPLIEEVKETAADVVKEKIVDKIVKTPAAKPKKTPAKKKRA